MSLNPSSASDSAFASECASPSAKLSFNINAFNGNTTNFNRCPAPTPKLTISPVQPQALPMPLVGSKLRIIRPAGSIMPM